MTTKKRMGRPPKDPKDVKNKQIPLAVSERQKAAYDSAWVRDGARSRNDWILRILDEVSDRSR